MGLCLIIALCSFYSSFMAKYINILILNNSIVENYAELINVFCLCRNFMVNIGQKYLISA